MNKAMLSWAGTTATVASALVNTEVREVISWVVTILVGIVTLGFTIYSWYKKASADGKITKEEVEELTDVLKENKKNENTK